MHTIGTPGLWSVFGLLVVVALIIDFVVLRAGGAYTPRARTFLAEVAPRCLQKPFFIDDVRAAVGVR